MVTTATSIHIRGKPAEVGIAVTLWEKSSRNVEAYYSVQYIFGDTDITVFMDTEQYKKHREILGNPPVTIKKGS